MDKHERRSRRRSDRSRAKAQPAPAKAQAVQPAAPVPPPQPAPQVERPHQSTAQEGPVQGRTFDWRGELARLMKHGRHFSRWALLHGRRLACRCHNMVEGHHAAGPISFLAVSGALGVALTLTTLYTPSYAVLVDGASLGVVSDQSTVETIVAQVESQGQEILGYDYQVDGDISYRFGLTLKSELTEPDQIENFFFAQLDEVGNALRKYQVSVDGQVMGVVEDKTALDAMLQELKAQYMTEQTISASFVESVSIDPVYVAPQVLEIEQLREKLTANTTGATTYTVVSGDTFNAIAYTNDMSSSELQALNPDFNINRLMIGDVLTVKETIPLLSVTTVEDVVYSEEIACPVETVEDANMYKGNSKIVTQGTPGEAQVAATVTYVNGRETGRQINSTTTLREPTVTTKAVGTKERPKTASSGNYSWPIRGRINSYFGGRYIFGSYSYHSGIDIQAAYGAAVKAADGGTVTFSGWKGSYGKLIIITHDNGTQTYYAHNSSLVVSAGTKVYKGQTIAKAGSTGRSTGTHCHFEVRVNGTAVNPLSYLR